MGDLGSMGFVAKRMAVMALVQVCGSKGIGGGVLASCDRGDSISDR